MSGRGSGGIVCRYGQEAEFFLSKCQNGEDAHLRDFEEQFFEYPYNGGVWGVARWRRRNVTSVTHSDRSPYLTKHRPSYPGVQGAIATPGGGYDVEIFAENPDDDLLCSICHGVLRCPVMVSCGHIFCRKCILQWLKRQPTCPCCRTEVKGKLLVQMHKLKKRINRLQVKCPNEAHGCPAIFPMLRTEEHAESCAFGLLCCSNEGCPAEVLRKDICEHSQNCQFWRDVCHMGCGTSLTPENRDEHNCYMELKELYNKQLHKLRQKARRIESLTTQMSRQIQLLSEGLEGAEAATSTQEPQ